MDVDRTALDRLLARRIAEAIRDDQYGNDWTAGYLAATRSLVSDIRALVDEN